MTKKLYSNDLKRLRKVKALTQEEIAKKLNVAPSTYSLYESGVRGISLDKAFILAQIFGLTIEELFFAHETCVTQKQSKVSTS